MSPPSPSPLFEGAFELAGIGMALVGLDGRWLRVNKALCEVVGYSAEELEALTFQDITHPEDLDADLAHVGRLIAGESTSYQMQKRYFRKDGSVVPILLTASLMRDAEGEPLQFIVQVQDISQRERARASIEQLAAELAAQTRLLENILEASSDHIYLHAPGGRYVYASASGLKALGLTREQVVGRTWRELGFPESAMGKFQEECDQVFETGVPVASSTVFPLADGDHYYEYVISPMFDPSGEKVVNVTSVARDATDRHEAERASHDQLVTKRFVQRAFRAFSPLVGTQSEPVRRRLGRSMADDAEGESLPELLAAFETAGLGVLELSSAPGDRFVFTGQRLLDLDRRGAMPSCHLALGYAEGVVERVTGKAALGSEVHCQAQGAKACEFEVMTREARPVPPAGRGRADAPAAHP